MELLVQHGGVAVGPLMSILKSSGESDTRCAALFGLFRIATSKDLPSENLSAYAKTKANQAIRAALYDLDFQVRIAAARSAGMARDLRVLNRLMQMVKKDEPPVRRQAATALGQIGDKRATAALICLLLTSF